MPDCLLCRLVSRDEEVSVVHEDERTVTFMDIEALDCAGAGSAEADPARAGHP